MKRLLLLLCMAALPVLLLAQNVEVEDVGQKSQVEIQREEAEKKRLEEERQRQEAIQKQQEAEARQQEAERQRQEAEARRAAQGCNVTLSVGDKAASIYVDGRRVGRFRWTGWLTYGKHRVECKREEYATTTRYITVQKGAKNNFSLDAPQPTSAQVTLSVGDSEAAIYVDGNMKGRGKWSGKLSFGTYKVECRKDKHRTTTETIRVGRDKGNTFQLSAPTPIYGSVFIDSQPAGAAVSIDGQQVGYTPLNIPQLLIGSYVVTVKKNFYEESQTMVTVRENQTASWAKVLESSIPVEIHTSPTSVSAYLSRSGDYNGKYYYTPIQENLPAGNYRVNIPRQHGSYAGVCKKNTWVTIDSMHTSHTIRLTRDNNYDGGVFLGADYNTALQAVGLNLGGVPAKGFLFELNFHWGLQSSETINWSSLRTASLDNYDLQQFNYKHWAVDLRMGPSFWCGPYLRISPELGAQYLHTRESKVGSENTMKHMFTGAYVSALGSVRFQLGLGQNFGVHITPEYRLNVTGKKMLPDVSKDVDKWVNGFGVKVGIYIYGYGE